VDTAGPAGGAKKNIGRIKKQAFGGGKGRGLGAGGKNIEKFCVR